MTNVGAVVEGLGEDGVNDFVREIKEVCWLRTAWDSACRRRSHETSVS